MSDSEPNPEPNQPTDATPTPPDPPKQDWLRTVARATETVAPLVARQAPKPDDIPADTRGRWATALAIAGILVAVLQFLVQFYDLVTRPLAPLAGALPYVAAGLLLAGAGAGIYALLRARTRRQRLASAGVTLVALLAAGSWGGWLAYEALRPPSGYRILISEFQGSQGTEYIDFSRRIAENLHTQLADAGLPIEIKRTTAVYADAETARREGANQQAGLVIWGWYDTQGVSPHVEVLRLPDSGGSDAPNIPIVFATANAATGDGGAPALQPVLSKLAPITAPPLTLPSLDLFTQYGADQMAYVAATVLAMSYLANNDLERALALFDQALASVAGDPAAAQGQAVVYYQRAAAHYRLGRYTAARADLEQALQLQPDYAPAHLLLAAVLANHCTPESNLAAALERARQAVALQSSNAVANRLLAELLLRSGDAAGALQSAQAAFKLEPNSVATQMLLAAVYAALGRDADSRTARETALTLAQAAADPTQAIPPTPDADALYQLGDAYMALDRYDEALAAYVQLQNIRPQDERLHPAKGNVYYWQGDYSAALAEYTAWAQQVPTDPAPHLLLGLVYDAQGQAEAAMAHYMQAADLGACDVAPYLLLAAAQANAGDYAAAGRTYARALTVNPQEPSALFAAGTNNLLQEDYVTAAEQFAALAELQPTGPGVHYYLGQAYTGLGNEAQAQTAYTAETAVGEADSAAPTAYLAYAYEKLGRSDDAIRVYVQLLKEKESADLHAYLGALYARKGAADLARQEFQAALALDPQHALAHLTQADLERDEGNFAAAAAGYEAYFAQVDPAATPAGLAQTHQKTALVYELLGDFPAALRHWQAAWQLAPGDAGLAQRAANAAYLLNRLEEAEQAAATALRLRPDDPALYALAGQVAYKRCDLAGAIAALQRAVELTPTHTIYVGSLGGYFLAQGDSAAAQPYTEQLRAAPANDYVAHWLVGNLLTSSLAAGDAETAAAAQAEYAVALAAPKLPPVAAAFIHSAAGHLAYMREDFATAEREFAASLAQVTDFADAAAGLGDIALLAGDVDAAEQHYQQAEELLGAYAARYAYDTAGVLTPMLHMRFALIARQRGDTATEQTALEAAVEALAPLQQAAPDWTLTLLAEGTLALIEDDEAAATAAFTRAAACDQTLAETPRQIEELVLAAVDADQADTD